MRFMLINAASAVDLCAVIRENRELMTPCQFVMSESKGVAKNTSHLPLRAPP